MAGGDSRPSAVPVGNGANREVPSGAMSLVDDRESLDLDQLLRFAEL